MKKRGLFCLFLFLVLTFLIQAQEKKRTYYGLEFDLLPYVTEGYHVGGWFRFTDFRFRGEVAGFNYPDFLIENSFNSNKITSVNFYIDYFFFPFMEKLWITYGLGAWFGEITAQNGEKSSYSHLMYTFGGGYIINLSRSLYVNPWAGFTMRLSGESHVVLGEEKFKYPLFVPLVTLKVGWRFKKRDIPSLR